MVTPDKDFAQLVSGKYFHVQTCPNKMISNLGIPEVLEKIEIERPDQVMIS